jgi:hypothetical protein
VSRSTGRVRLRAQRCAGRLRERRNGRLGEATRDSSSSWLPPSVLPV